MAQTRYGFLPDSEEYDSIEGSSQLRIKVVAGNNLAKKDIFGASDPYVRIDLISINGDVVSDTVFSKTKKKTLNPIWNEEFILRVKPTEHKVVLQVFDENRLTRDDFLGMVELHLANLPNEQEGHTIPFKSYELGPRSAKSKVRGTLDIYHAYVRDVNAPPPSATDPEWEIVDNGIVSPATNIFDTTTELPTGWEERQDANGRTYFISHIDRTTQWVRPTTQQQSNINGSRDTDAAMASEFQRRFHISVDETDSRSQGDTLSLSSEIAYNNNNTQRSGSVTSLNPSELSISDVNNSSNPVSPNHSINRPVRRAPAIPRALDRSQRRQAPAVPPRSSTTSPTENIERDLQSNNNELNSLSETTEDAQSNSENEDADTSESIAVAVTVAQSTASPSTESRQSSLEDSSPDAETTTGTNNLEAGLPDGWNMQVAPNGRVFFINHKERTTSWVDPRTGSASPMPATVGPTPKRTDDDLGLLPEGWEERIHSDGRSFYIDHNNRKTQWDDPRFSTAIAGQAVPYSRDYKQKYEYFKNQIKKPTNVPNKFEIKIRRASIFEDSYRVISSVNKTDLLKTKLWIEFENETGLDYGGLAREWFYLLSKEMFNPYYGLFEYSAMDNYTLQINAFSGLCNEEHLTYFKFIGRIAGMAVYHGKLLDGFFIRPFYKMMLQKPIDLRDMESVDMEYYNSLMWIKENDPSELMLTFSIDEETFGHTSQRELKPNGTNIDVTNENKAEYIRLVIEWRFVARVKDQMSSFLDGFGTIVPLSLLKIFDENELELLMCGIQNIDVKDWKQNTLYKGEYHPHHLIIQWFWKAVLSFSNEMRSRLLQFVTGTSRVPMNGFNELYGSNGPQMFTIEKWGSSDNFPRAHTCFNRLDLPPYESFNQLKEKLVRAIEGSQGFAGVD